MEKERRKRDLYGQKAQFNLTLEEEDWGDVNQATNVGQAVRASPKPKFASISVVG